MAREIKYYLVAAEALPEIFVKVAEAKRMMQTGEAATVGEATRMAGISRSAFYKYKDSVQPFLDYKGKWSVVLALTSNGSANDFEMLSTGDMPLYEKVIKTTMTWGSKEDIMFVVGATRPEKLAEIREYCPDNFFLVPGVGAQGGTVDEVAKYGLNSHCGLLVNSSRGIIFADKTERFAQVAGEKAKELADQMAKWL